MGLMGGLVKQRGRVRRKSWGSRTSPLDFTDTTSPALQQTTNFHLITSRLKVFYEALLEIFPTYNFGTEASCFESNDKYLLL